MTDAKLVPNRFLFRFELPLRRFKTAPKLTGDPEAWGDRHLLPRLCTLDDEEGFGDVYAGWDDSGLFVGCVVSGKMDPPFCHPAEFRKSDHLRLMTDMRDARQIRRATRYCQEFFFMASGGGPRAKDATAASVEIPRAQEDAPFVGPGRIPIASKVSREGYRLTAQLTREVLVGFDPGQSARIGFFYMLEDVELGHQSLTVDDELNWWMDPSTWPTAVLVD